MKLHHSLLLVSALSVAAGSAFAQAPAPLAAPGVDQRQANQHLRIDQGVASGALTAREARHLTREQKVVASAENRAKADDTVTAQERKRLHNLQDKTGRDIHRQKHDLQTKPATP